MKPEAEQLVRKAEGDFLTMERECAAENCVEDSVCFHAQQCVEKYLKAVLVEHDIHFPKVHDLVRIATLLPSGFEIPAEHFSMLPDLSAGAVEFRYTVESATPAEAQNFASLCRTLRLFRQRLGLTIAS
jgi:HEPN domain-containing protein